MNDPRYQDLIAKSAHGIDGTDESAPMLETKPLISDYIVGYDKDSGAVFIRHTSEIMFKVTPFQKEGDDYFKLTQYGDDEQIVKEMYLCLGEMEGLQELIADMLKQRAREIMGGGA